MIPNQKKSKEELMRSFDANMPAVLASVEPPRNVSAEEADRKIIKDADEDYQYARDKIKALIDQNAEAAERLMTLAMDSEHPRAFEVLANLIKTGGDLSKELMNIAKDRKAVHHKKPQAGAGIPVAAGGTTNNIIFSGTTVELQKQIQASLKGITDGS